MLSGIERKLELNLSVSLLVRERDTVAQPRPAISVAENGLQQNTAYSHDTSLAIVQREDDPEIRLKYRPFILKNDGVKDWVNTLELTTALDMAAEELRKTNNRLKVLVLYGSLRLRSYSRLVALEASRILFRLGCDVRVFNPDGLPVKNDIDHGHPKVQELREMSKWSDGHVWVSPEQHGNLVRLATPPHHGVYWYVTTNNCRPPSSKIRLTGFRSLQVACVPHKAVLLPSLRCAVDRNHLTRLTLFVALAGGCGCLLSQIRSLSLEHTSSFLTKVNQEMRGSCLVVIGTG